MKKVFLVLSLSILFTTSNSIAVLCNSKLLKFTENVDKIFTNEKYSEHLNFITKILKHSSDIDPERVSFKACHYSHNMACINIKNLDSDDDIDLKFVTSDHVSYPKVLLLNNERIFLIPDYYKLADDDEIYFYDFFQGQSLELKKNPKFSMQKFGPASYELNLDKLSNKLVYYNYSVGDTLLRRSKTLTDDFQRELMELYNKNGYYTEADYMRMAKTRGFAPEFAFQLLGDLPEESKMLVLNALKTKPNTYRLAIRDLENNRKPLEAVLSNLHYLKMHEVSEKEDLLESFSVFEIESDYYKSFYKGGLDKESEDFIFSRFEDMPGLFNLLYIHAINQSMEIKDPKERGKFFFDALKDLILATSDALGNYIDEKQMYSFYSSINDFKLVDGSSFLAHDHNGWDRYQALFYVAAARSFSRMKGAPERFGGAVTYVTKYLMGRYMLENLVKFSDSNARQIYTEAVMFGDGKKQSKLSSDIKKGKVKNPKEIELKLEEYYREFVSKVRRYVSTIDSARKGNREKILEKETQNDNIKFVRFFGSEDIPRYVQKLKGFYSSVKKDAVDTKVLKILEAIRELSEDSFSLFEELTKSNIFTNDAQGVVNVFESFVIEVVELGLTNDFKAYKKLLNTLKKEKILDKKFSGHEQLKQIALFNIVQKDPTYIGYTHLYREEPEKLEEITNIVAEEVAKKPNLDISNLLRKLKEKYPPTEVENADTIIEEVISERKPKKYIESIQGKEIETTRLDSYFESYEDFDSSSIYTTSIPFNGEKRRKIHYQFEEDFLSELITSKKIPEYEKKSFLHSLTNGFKKVQKFKSTTNDLYEFKFVGNIDHRIFACLKDGVFIFKTRERGHMQGAARYQKICD